MARRNIKPKFSGRILARLIEAESLTSDPWQQDEYRIAYLTVLYAAQGHAQPHVEATYRVLGIHPEKVWPALIARRKAKTGPCYESLYDQHGCWKPCDLSEVQSLPPKKPADSVRPAYESQRRIVGKEDFSSQKENGADWSCRAASEFGKPAMASPQTSYRRSSEFASENDSQNLAWRLLKLAENSDLHPRNRMVLLAMLKCNRFSVVGSKNELYPATLTVAVMLGLPYITVRRAIDRLEEVGVLVLVHPENWIHPDGDVRRPRTYQVNPEKLSPRLTIREHRKLRFGRNTKRQGCAASQPETPPPAPVPITPPQAKPAHESRPQPKRTRRECKKFLERMALLLEPVLSRTESGWNNEEVSQYLITAASKVHKYQELIHLGNRLDALAGQALRGELKLNRLQDDLTAIETALFTNLAERTDEEVLDRISRKVNEQLAAYRDRMPPESYGETAKLAAASLLLEEWKLPRLSLFYLPEKRIAAVAGIERDAAFKAACKYFQFSEASVIEGLKHWGFEVSGLTEADQ